MDTDRIEAIAGREALAVLVMLGLSFDLCLMRKQRGSVGGVKRARRAPVLCRRRLEDARGSKSCGAKVKCPSRCPVYGLGDGRTRLIWSFVLVGLRIEDQIRDAS